MTMKVAIIGSRDLVINDLEKYLPFNTTEIVSGGAKGIDECAKKYAEQKSIPIKIFLPEYEKFGKRAPLVRNIQIIEYADTVVAFWNGISRGTKYVIDNCKAKGKEIKVYKF